MIFKNSIIIKKKNAYFFLKTTLNAFMPLIVLSEPNQEIYIIRHPTKKNIKLPFTNKN